MTARRASTVAVASVVAVVVLVVVLATWASSIGPSGVLRGDGPSPAGTPTDTRTSTSAAPKPAQADDGEHQPTPAWLRLIATVVNVAVLVAFVVLLAWLGRASLRRWRIRRFRRRRLAATDEVDFAVVEPPARVVREMLADAASQRQLLLEGTPRNAVVACWHRFETQGAAAGLERRVWETSSEYAMRVLDLVDAHEPAVARLAVLYREARFSEHDLTEADRQEALEALDTIHRTIGVPA